jgi:flavin reductase
MAGITSEDFRAALGAFATGVTVVTTRGEDDHAYGMTANAFSSLSLDPPLILVCTILLSEGTAQIQRNQVFAVNILAADQEPLSRYFASRDRPRGRDAFSEVDHWTSVTGSPILKGAICHLDCRLHSSHTAGDHEIMIGEVVDLALDREAAPLLFHSGKYRLLHPGQ